MMEIKNFIDFLNETDSSDKGITNKPVGDKEDEKDSKSKDTESDFDSTEHDDDEIEDDDIADDADEIGSGFVPDEDETTQSRRRRVLNYLEKNDIDVDDIDDIDVDDLDDLSKDEMEEIEEDDEQKELDEALSKASRLKLKNSLRRNKSKIARKRKLAMSRMPSMAKLKTRAKKAAILLVKKKLSKGRDLKKLSFAERVRFEKIIKKKAGLIKRLAKKLLPKIKKIAVTRIKNKNKK